MGGVRWWRGSRAVTLAACGVLAVVLVGCGSPAPGPDAAGPNAVPPFAVVSGDGGVATVGAGWFEPVTGLRPGTHAYEGPVAVGVDGSTAVVLGADAIALVRPHQPAVRAECADCSGLAVHGDRIVTTSKNFSPGDGFDIVEFTTALAPGRTVAAQRLPERAATDYPAENTESPVTLAADRDAVTVGYLSRNGGNRRGPSIIAKYGYDGRLLRHAVVDGLVGRSAVSPDGRQLGLDVTGSAGYCVSLSRTVVVDLESLRVRPLQPEVPGGATARDSLTQPWFDLSDLAWDGGDLVATGEVNVPRGDDVCDPDPGVWQRRFDPATARVADSGPSVPQGKRWVGPGCADVVTVTGHYADAVLARGAGGGAPLGHYDKVDLGRVAPPPGC